MNPILGKAVLLEVYSTQAAAYIPFICARDMSISINPELVNTTTVSSGRWFTYKARRIDWELSLSGVSTILGSGWIVFSTVIPANIFTGHLIRMTFTDPLGNTAVFTGKVVLKSASISGNEGSFSEYENTFQGSGAYTLVVTANNTAPPVYQRIFSQQFSSVFS